MVREAHNNGKPFILHSCGNLREVYADLLDECRIDAKHSFEDIILPVEEFKQQYGTRVTPLGGLDVDVICRGSRTKCAPTPAANRPMLQRRLRALGTGNSLTNYMPVENYFRGAGRGLQAAPAAC